MAKKMRKPKSTQKRKAKPRKKSATLSLRLAPELKAVARRLARGGRRSLNGLVEFLIRQEAERLAAKSPRKRART
jgi:hypothetical protein